MRSRSARNFRARWQTLFEKGRAAFRRRFWNEARRTPCGRDRLQSPPGDLDLTFRPNQIFAVGGLPLQVLSGGKARRVVDAVEARLLTPVGLRSLAPGEPGYAPHYGGGVAQRDGSYHQGTVWPWLIGAFVEAWVRVRGSTTAAKEEARARFLPPLVSSISTRRDSATSRRFAMPNRRTRHAVARSRHGR